MRKPPCKKCGSKNTFLDRPRFQPDQVYLGCITCGWRLYGEASITAFVEEYNADLVAAEKSQRLEKANKTNQAAVALRKARRRERDRRYRARLKEKKQVYIIPNLEIQFQVGDLDPVLKVPWAKPVPNKEGENLHPCAWPPCEQRARANSKYCSRKCCVKVAHRRDRLRKKGELKERIAS
jgi:hypothetical protein